MKKHKLDLILKSNISINDSYQLLKFTTSDKLPLPEMYPGQFVEILVKDSSKTFLRRPISINFIDRDLNELWLLVQIIGEGTRQISDFAENSTVDMLLPLGNSFTIPKNSSNKILLVGGGVGIAPLLYLGHQLKIEGFTPIFLLGARSRKDLLQLDLFSQYGEVCITTEDGSLGEKGYVTNHSILKDEDFSFIYTCGPKPMMLAVAQYAHDNNIECEVSLENTMACGFGVCLCCVENTKKGNVCVCTEGPVFNIKDLKWID